MTKLEGRTSKRLLHRQPQLSTSAHSRYRSCQTMARVHLPIALAIILQSENYLDWIGAELCSHVLNFSLKFSSHVAAMTLRADKKI
jgi:hypothetical protein